MPELSPWQVQTLAEAPAAHLVPAGRPEKDQAMPWPLRALRVSTKPAASTAPMLPGHGIYKVGTPYTVGNRTFVPAEDPNYDATGLASWYGEDFHGKQTANGETFDMNALVAAHPTLPMPSYVLVTNLKNGRTVVLRVNNRGPYAEGRILDVSKEAATQLGFVNNGVTQVRVQYAGRAPLDGNDARERAYLVAQPWYSVRAASNAAPGER